MRRLLLSVFLATLAVSFVAASAADKQVNPVPLQTIEPQPIFGPFGPEQACQVGNLNPPAWAIPGFILAPEEYKLAFDPHAGCSICPIGFQVHTIHVLLQSSAACTIVMGMDLEQAVFPTSPDCPEPGPVLCNSGLFTVNLPSAGLWDIGLPIICNCLTMDAIYLLSVHFESVSCADGTVPDLITDAGPATLCTNWNNFGAGWIDIVAQYPTWPGNLSFSADADCCTPPVPVDSKTWGAIKELYND